MVAAVRTPVTNRRAGHGKDLLSAVGPGPQTFSRKHPDPLLQIEGLHGEWEAVEVAEWRRITRGADGTDDTLTIAIDALRGFKAMSEHFRYWLAKFNPNTRVRLIAPWGDADHRVLFQGFPMPVTMSWSPRHQSMSITCLSEGQERLRCNHRANILGRWMRYDPSSEWVSATSKIVEVETLDVVFNAGGKPNRTAESYRFGAYTGEPGGEGGEEDTRPKIHLFTTDNEPGAAYWTYVQALRYLAWMHIVAAGSPIGVDEFLQDTEACAAWPPTGSTSEPFDRRITATCPEVSAQSLNVEEAIAVLCERAGLHYHVPVRGEVNEEGDSLQARFYLRVYSTVSSHNEQTVIKRRFMRESAVFDLPRETPFTDMTGRDAQAVTEGNKIQECNLTMDPRGHNVIVGRGGAIEYEVTMLLRPGWEPHEYLDLAEGASSLEIASALNFWAGEFDPEYDETFDEDGVPVRMPRSIYHGQHPENASVANVFRLWVFPDSLEYVEQGLERRDFGASWYTPFMVDGGGVPRPGEGLIYRCPKRGACLAESIIANWVPRRRPFGNTIRRRDLGTGDTAPLIEVNFKHDGGPETALSADGWVPFTGQAFIDPQRGAVRIIEDNIFAGVPLLANPAFPGADEETAIARYLRRQFYVRITCTIRADQRMRAWAGGRCPRLGRLRKKTVDYGQDRFRVRDVASGNSAFTTSPDETDPAYLPRDDTERLKQQAGRDVEQLAVDTVSASPEIYWIDQTYWPGDSFSGCDGLAIPFFTFPAVERIEYVNQGGGYRTVLHLTDLRDQPEVGCE